MNFMHSINIKKSIKDFIYNTSQSKYLNKKSNFYKLLKVKSQFNIKWTNRNSLILLNTYKLIYTSILINSTSSLVFLDLNLSHNISNSNIKSKSTHNLCFLLNLNKNNTWLIDYVICKEFSPTLYASLQAPHFSFQALHNYIKSKISYYESLTNNFNSISTFSSSSSKNAYRHISTYTPDKAIEYANKHALNYNSEYESFDSSGGDCTNFASQTLHFAGLKKTTNWKPYSNSWLRVNELRNYIIYNNLGSEHFILTDNMSGALVQFFHKEKKAWTHSGILTYQRANDYLYCCHSYDKLHYPLSLAYPSIYPKIRIILPF